MDVSLWTTRLDTIASDAIDRDASELAGRLDDDERRRAGAFRFERDRLRFVASRVFLRAVLAHHLERAPEALRFATEDGKPRLVEPADAPDFNASRSGDVAVVAVGQGARVGVDVERVRPLDDLEGLATTVMNASELESWSALPDAERVERFYAVWTRKEALGKAEGHGLEPGPKAIPVPVAELAPGEWLGLRTESGHWMLSDFRLDGETRACLVVESPSAPTNSGRYSDRIGTDTPPLAGFPAAKRVVRRFRTD